MITHIFANIYRGKMKKNQYILICIITALFLFHNRVYVLGQGEVYLLKEDETRWDSSTELNIFVTEAGEEILKPGISGEYIFSIRNTCSRDIYFRLNMKEDRAFPLRYSVQSEQGEWFLGTAEEKVSLLSGDIGIQGKITAESQLSFTLYWEWVFEEGEDERDTYLGNTQMEEYQIFFHFQAGDSKDEILGNDAGEILGESDVGALDEKRNKFFIECHKLRTMDYVEELYVMLILMAMVIIIVIAKKKTRDKNSDIEDEIGTEHINSDVEDEIGTEHINSGVEDEIGTENIDNDIRGE